MRGILHSDSGTVWDLTGEKFFLCRERPGRARRDCGRTGVVDMLVLRETAERPCCGVHSGAVEVMRAAAGGEESCAVENYGVCTLRLGEREPWGEEGMAFALLRGPYYALEEIHSILGRLAIDTARRVFLKVN